MPTDLARRALLAMAAVPAVAAGAARAGDAELERAVEAYDRATVANDVDALAELVLDDYLLVNSDTTVQDKRSYLADFTVPGFRLEPYVLEEPVRKLWGDTALVGGRLHLRWTQDGLSHARRLRIAHVWRRDGGRWRLAYTQLTRVPVPAG